MHSIQDVIDAITKYHNDIIDAKYWGGPTIMPVSPFSDQKKLLKIAEILEAAQSQLEVMQSRNEVYVGVLKYIHDRAITSSMDVARVHEKVRLALLEDNAN